MLAKGGQVKKTRSNEGRSNAGCRYKSAADTCHAPHKLARRKCAHTVDEKSCKIRRELKG